MATQKKNGRIAKKYKYVGSRYPEHTGYKLTLVEYSELCGISSQTIYARIKDKKGIITDKHLAIGNVEPRGVDDEDRNKHNINGKKMTVDDIAERCGFTRNHLYAVRRKTGQTFEQIVNSIHGVNAHVLHKDELLVTAMNALPAHKMVCNSRLM